MTRWVVMDMNKILGRGDCTADYFITKQNIMIYYSKMRRWIRYLPSTI